MKDKRGDAARVSVSAPITAPMGETRPPVNSPPPRITPAIPSRVYPLPMLASAEVGRPTNDKPDSPQNSPATANKVVLILSNDQPARRMATGLPPDPRKMTP